MAKPLLESPLFLPCSDYLEAGEHEGKRIETITIRLQDLEAAILEESQKTKGT